MTFRLGHLGAQAEGGFGKIADALIRYDMAIGEKESSDAGTDEQTRQRIHAIFRDKYELLEGADRASE